MLSKFQPAWNVAGFEVAGMMRSVRDDGSFSNRERRRVGEPTAEIVSSAEPGDVRGSGQTRTSSLPGQLRESQFPAASSPPSLPVKQRIARKVRVLRLHHLVLQVVLVGRSRGVGSGENGHRWQEGTSERIR